MDCSTFVGQCIIEMLEHDVTIHFNKRKNYSKDTGNSFGIDPRPIFTINYFDNSPDDIFRTFLHEYCHFNQWKEDTLIWKNGLLGYQIFYDWLDGERKSCSKKYITDLQLIELDADKRALKLIDKLNLPIDKNQYIKESNAYVLAWYYNWKTKDLKEFPNYGHEKILEVVPNIHLTRKTLNCDFGHVMKRFDLYK